MYKQKKNEKSTKNKWKRSRSKDVWNRDSDSDTLSDSLRKRGASDGRGPIGRGRKK